MTARDDRFTRRLGIDLGPKFHDVRAEVERIEGSKPGVARPGGEGAVSMYVVHHTAGSTRGTWRGIWDFHTRTNGWATGGYNALVDMGGDLYLTVPPSRMSYGAGSRWNPTTVHVCAIGNFMEVEPSPEMLETIWTWLCVCDDILGYKPWRPHGAIRQTACPGTRLRPHVEAMAKRGALSPRPATYR